MASACMRWSQILIQNLNSNFYEVLHMYVDLYEALEVIAYGGTGTTHV